MTEETKGWTPERRAAQRERILKQKPWEKSTGPRTERGKMMSSLNSTRHGLRSNVAIKTQKFIRAGKKTLKAYRETMRNDRESRRLGQEMRLAIELKELKLDIKSLAKPYLRRPAN